MGNKDNSEKILRKLYIMDELLCDLENSSTKEQDILLYGNMLTEIRNQIDNLEKILYPEPEYNSLWDEKIAGLQLENDIKVYL